MCWRVTADVIVTDGFTGNVALKLLEGTSKILLGQVKEAMMATAITKLAGAALKPAMLHIKERLDPDTYGGAPLLGVDGVCIIGHGSSRPDCRRERHQSRCSGGRGRPHRPHCTGGCGKLD